MSAFRSYMPQRPSLGRRVSPLDVAMAVAGLGDLAGIVGSEIDVFMDLINHRSRAEEARVQLNPAIAWGRYRELCEYAVARGDQSGLLDSTHAVD